jgi:hypothetical protein
MNTDIINGFRKAIKFAIWGSIGGAIGNIITEPWSMYSDRHISNSLTEGIVYTSVWCGLLGVGITISLLSASFDYLNRGLQLGKAIKDGLWFGFVAGAISGVIGQYIYITLGATEFIRIIVWGIMGGLLGLGASFRIPNLGQLRASSGGFIGGLLGGSLFVLIAVIFKNSQTIARLSGTAAIGFCIGLAIVIMETVLREAWLEIRYNARESKTISLGSQPITIGSNPNLCNVYVRNAPPVALRYQLVQGKIICEDVSTGRTINLKPGEEQNVGTVTMLVCGTLAASPQSIDTPNNSASDTYIKTVFQPPMQFSLHIKRQVMNLTEGTCLSAREIPGLEPQGVDGVVAKVNPNPKEPSILGLQNCSYQPWISNLVSGEQKQIEPGRSIRLIAGTKINFGSVVGEIH